MMLMGRREIITAPTVENPVAATVFSSQKSKMCTPGWDVFKPRSQRLNAVNAMESAHRNHANQEAVRRLIPPPIPSCFLSLSVTTSLYSAAVS
jgi:hypothetical protein